MLKKTLTLFFPFGVTALFATIDINHASKKELQSVKGIGPKKAQRIVDYRKKHCFESVDKLTKIRGIGKKTLEKIKSQMTLTPCNQKAD